MYHSGTFIVTGVSSEVIGTLWDAIPLPLLLVDESFSIIFSNKAAEKLVADRGELEGGPVLRLFAATNDIFTFKGALEEAFHTSHPQLVEGAIGTDTSPMWARVHFRAIRVEVDRFVLVLVEDLGHEGKPPRHKDKHEQELLRVRRELEERIRAHSDGIAKATERLRREIALREESERERDRAVRTLEKTLDSAVIALVSMAEKRDPFNAHHQRRVAQLACAIAEEMRLSERLINCIGIAAAVHDIGKISVPGEVMNKPGRLSDHEYGMIREHAETGFQILKELDFGWPLAEIVLQHHERIDGTGYPRGITGPQISLEARVVAVADVVEAMSSHRPFRPAWRTATVIDELNKNRGRLYDDDVAEACLRVLKNDFVFV